MALDEKHLSVAQIEWFLGTPLNVRDAEGLTADYDQASRHLASCAECKKRVSMELENERLLNHIRGGATARATADCLPETSLRELAAGLTTAEEADRLFHHVAQCDHCGALLREASAALNSELSADEEVFIGRLSSSQADWQRALARRLATAEVAAERGAAELKAAPERVPADRSVLAVLLSGRGMRWAATAAVTFLLVAGAVTWFLLSQPSLSATNQLIARAYTAQRTIPLRIPDTRYGPIRQQRGEQGSRLDQPQELLDAEVQISRQLERNPGDPGWLQAKARAALLEGDFQAALDALTRAAVVRPSDATIQMDLATAYFERGQASGAPSQECARGAELLAQVLQKDSTNLVALFNRALILECGHDYTEAASVWRQYLKFDPSGEWSAEAREHHAEAQRKSGAIR